MTDKGIVYFVGSGPGDPDLITLRGVQCLAIANTVVYDNLANDYLLNHAPQAAERIYVGKKSNCHTLKQEEINKLLVNKAKEGLTVVRLKGGDPFVFGRGGEEILAIRKEDIPFEVVPGVTAGVAAPAYAGISVTHRECNSVLTFITGHEDPAKNESAINWNALAAGGGTLVFYMGMKNLPDITQKLVSAGRSPDTPAAVIQKGTSPEQRTITGTLEDISQKARDANMAPPSIIVVGEVVSLRPDMNWFEQLPLFGKKILVTRTRSQASDLIRKLCRLGAYALPLPTISIVPPDDPKPLNEVTSHLPEFDWIIFTSPNAVESFFKSLNSNSLDSRNLGGIRICSIGPGTATKLRNHGINTDLMPQTHTSEAIFEALKETNLAGKRILLPRANIAPHDLPEKLEQSGAEITEVTAYKTIPAQPEQDVLESLRNEEADIVTFTSSSTAKNFAELVRKEFGKLPKNISYASIGPETSKAARAEGLDIEIEATKHTIDGLIDAMVKHFGNKGS
ncbi:uroporphyrinogen-III C-methyltransferase [Verrucomicrobiota bacterium]